MKTIQRFGFLVIAFMLCAPALQAQELMGADKTLRFFMEKALEDALHEQQLQLPFEEDELDFWKDQRNFERALKKQSYTAYHVYVNSKWEAYSKHSASHSIDCNHSTQYYKQAAFYARNSNKSLVAQAIEQENATVQSSTTSLEKKQ
ncbi:MAG: hypothetical protein AB3N16_02710 [Flavobacteriaceae bacterium]